MPLLFHQNHFGISNQLYDVIGGQGAYDMKMKQAAFVNPILSGGFLKELSV